jgi:hypothetical protein
MSDDQHFGFGKFVPGFDFLQNIAKGSSPATPQMPSLSSWVAPTLNVEDLQKRIDELKAVHFWLDQNSKALSATVQALELQKMTLATLRGMNFNMAEVANALTLKAADNPFAQATTSAASGPGPVSNNVAQSPPAEPAGPAAAKPRKSGKGGDKNKSTGQGAPGLVDPLQWWGALTQQFQEIAAAAMKDAGRHPAVEAATNLSADATRAAMKLAGAAGDSGAAPAPKAAGRKTAAKTAAKTTTGTTGTAGKTARKSKSGSR